MLAPPHQTAPVPLPADFKDGWQAVRAAERGLHWHPQVRELLVHWLTLCGADGRLPSRNALDSTLLGALQPRAWMLDVHRAPWRFRYRMAGAAFIAALGIDITNQWYDEARPLSWSVNRMRLITTVRDGVPTWRRGRVPMEEMTSETGDWAEIENLMLPLACDGHSVDTVLGISMPYRPIELWDATPADSASIHAIT